MILSLFNLFLFVFLVRYGFKVRYKSTEGENSFLLFVFSELFAFVALGMAFVTIKSSEGSLESLVFAMEVGTPVIALFFARMAVVLSVIAPVFLLYLAFSFPYPIKWGRAPFITAIVVGLIAMVLVFSGGYYSAETLASQAAGEASGVWARAINRVVKLSLFGFEESLAETGNSLVYPGPFYIFINTGIAASFLISAIVLFIRRLFFKSKIYRLQVSVCSIFLLLAAVAWYLMAIDLPSRFGQTWAWSLLPLSPLILIMAFSYSMSITRIFAVREVLKTAFSFSIYAVILGLASGTAIALTWNAISSVSIVLAILFVLAVFSGASLLASIIRRRFEGFLRSGNAYGDALEEQLSTIDFSLGRDAVIGKFLSLLRDYIDCTSVNLLVENSEGALVNIGSTNGIDTAFDHRSNAIEFLLNSDVSVIMKTELVTNYEYHDVKGDLLDILDSFDGDLLIILREGRSIIGAIVLGAKRTGSDFTDYDFSVISRLYGKLFVVSYYFKNVAQESLVLTVDRELEFSDQIIQSIQENIDRIEHPAVDLSYMTRSARKLGGDFLDFIKISKERYIVILGDVSGKGLNASMSMVILKSVIRTFLRETKDFKRLVIKVNDFIKTNLPRGTFFAGIFGIIDFESRTLFYVNCGVPAMFLLSSSYNNPVEIQGGGKVLGFVKDIEPHINVRKAVFKSGDILLTTTDGLTDAESIRGARFGKERIQASLIENRSQTSERIVRFLSESVEEFIQQELSDDITILAIKFL